jgi:hypothetical protein
MKSLIRKILKEGDWDFLADDPLEFVGGEVYIDIKGLSYNQRIEMFNKLENDIGELNLQIGSSDDTTEGRIGNCFNLRTDAILLHCGHEDNEYNPKKNDVCCMRDVSFEDLKSDTHDYHNGGLTYVNGGDLIDTQPMFESEDKDFSRDIGTPEELKDFLYANQKDIVDWVEEGIEEYPPGEIGEEDTKQWIRDFSGEITPGRFLLTYDDFTHGGYDEDMFRSVYKEFVEETYNKFFGVTDILGKLEGLKEDKDWDWMGDIDTPLKGELEYILRGSDFHITNGRNNNPRYFDIMRGVDLMVRANTKANMGELISELKGSIPYNYENEGYGEYWIDFYDSIKVLINILENSMLNESEDSDWGWVEDVPEEPLMNSEFDITDPKELLRPLIEAMDELEMEDLDGLSEKQWKKLIKVVLKTEEFKWYEEKVKFRKLPWNLQASNLLAALNYL